jgi:hypothetical protein
MCFSPGSGRGRGPKQGAPAPERPRQGIFSLAKLEEKRKDPSPKGKIEWFHALDDHQKNQEKRL